MKTARFSPSQIWTVSQLDNGNAVYIRPEGSSVALPVYVSESDIQTILVELTHVLAPRPMVYELLLETIEALQGKLERVEIYGIRNGSYLSRLILSHHGKEIPLESRPSDILCLSARMQCPICVDDDLLAQSGVPVDRVAASPERSASSSDSSSVVSFLRHELQTALEKEEYERAAILRDRLSSIPRLQSDHA
jgi:uncharacterized protein